MTYFGYDITSMKPRVSFRRNKPLRGVLSLRYSRQPRCCTKSRGYIMATSRRLQALPTLWRVGRNTGTRELVLERYPYTIVYRLTSTKIRVLAVLHQSRQYP